MSISLGIIYCFVTMSLNKVKLQSNIGKDEFQRMMDMLRALFKNSMQKITPKDAKIQMENDSHVVLLDVRTPQEHREARIPSSVNVPLFRIDHVQRVLPQKDAKIFVYCQSGARASVAGRQLSKMGYTNVYNLGGIIKWPYDIVSGKERT